MAYWLKMMAICDMVVCVVGSNIIITKNSQAVCIICMWVYMHVAYIKVKVVALS